MEKLWSARFGKELDELANDFNSSIRIDSRMYEEDIRGSIAHAEMLKHCDILEKSEADSIIRGLASILDDINCGKLNIDMQAEDIHTFIEGELTDRIGDPGKRLHTARSRNDQVALDTRLCLIKEERLILRSLKYTVTTLIEIAKEHKLTIMSGYTHLQKAQPITFAAHMLAYANMFMRDMERISQTIARTEVSPLGSAALAGTTYPIDRSVTAQILGLKNVTNSSLDGVSDRDFVIEAASDIAIIMMHLSRFSEEIILWSSWEFKFIELDDGYSTGSSIMPQKKNPDMAELVRGKCARTYGSLMALLTMMKGLPLAYNKDMQEDKELIFDSIDTVKLCLDIFAPMLKTMKVNKKAMLKSGEKGFINATDCADYLVKKGLPFRDSYKIVGKIVAYCIDNGLSLNELDIDTYKSFSSLFDEDVYEAIDLVTCVEKRNSFGGVSSSAVEKQIEILEEETKKYD